MLRRRAFAPLLAIALCGVMLMVWACAPARVTPETTPLALNGAALQPAVDLPSLNFDRADGGTFTTADTRGRMSLFFFGYTHCADVCPTTLSEFVRIRKSLGSDAAAVDMYFVTLDPARDTLERMHAYVGNFPGVTGLIGSEGEITEAQSTFHVVYERREMPDGDYMLDHTAAIYLVNPASQIQLAYPYGTDSEDIVADLRLLLTSTPAANLK